MRLAGSQLCSLVRSYNKYGIRLRVCLFMLSRFAVSSLLLRSIVRSIPFRSFVCSFTSFTSVRSFASFVLSLCSSFVRSFSGETTQQQQLVCAQKPEPKAMPCMCVCCGTYVACCGTPRATRCRTTATTLRRTTPQADVEGQRALQTALARDHWPEARAPTTTTTCAC